MKHIAQIQVEFLKAAAKWEDLSYEAQKAYLKQHRKSKKKMTAKPGEGGTDVSELKDEISKKKEELPDFDSAMQDIGDVLDILGDARSFLKDGNIDEFETEMSDALDINIAFPENIPEENKKDVDIINKAVQELNNIKSKSQLKKLDSLIEKIDKVSDNLEKKIVKNIVDKNLFDFNNDQKDYLNSYFWGSDKMLHLVLKKFSKTNYEEAKKLLEMRHAGVPVTVIEDFLSNIMSKGFYKGLKLGSAINVDYKNGEFKLTKGQQSTSFNLTDNANDIRSKLENFIEEASDQSDPVVTFGSPKEVIKRHNVMYKNMHTKAEQMKEYLDRKSKNPMTAKPEWW